MDEFIQDDAAADAAVKAVLGTLASRLPDDESRTFTEALPSPLNYETLRSHQVNPTAISADDFPVSIATQFKVNEDQANMLIQKVLHVTKQSLDEGEWQQTLQGLPQDWQNRLQAA